MQKDVRELNGLIETISQKMIDKTINDRYLMSRMAVIVNEFDPITNSASIIIPTDLQNPTTYKYPNRTGKNKLNSTVWEDGAIKTYGDKVYLIYQTNNISQGWLESNEALVLDAGTIDYNELENRPQINGVTLEGNLTTSDIGITIPTKTSDLTNDSGFLDANDFKTVNNQSIVGSGNIQIDSGTKFVKGTPITLYDTDGTTPLHNLLPENILFYDGNQGSSDLFNYNSLDNKPSINGVTLIGNKTTDDLGIVSKFIKGTPINLYDTDGTTVLYSRNPENLVFYDGDSGEDVASNFIFCQPSAGVTLSTSDQTITTWAVKKQKGNGFEMSGGQVKCNKNGRVKVIAVANIYGASGARDHYHFISKNGANQASNVIYNSYSGTLTNVDILNVVAGDLISTRAHSSVAGSGYTQRSQLLCEYIEDYYITQAISESNTYSTDEIEIGRWIDGKPIYRKVVSFSMTAASSWTNVAHGISNLGTVINYYGMVYATDGNWDKIPQFRTGGYGVTIYVGSNNIAYTNDWLSGTTSAFLIIEYTKTTD